MHPKNPHKDRYDLTLLSQALPKLRDFIIEPHGQKTIDFSNPEAVKILNHALLKSFYGIEHWDIPKDFLCPPIPGRADYIHTVSDLFDNPHGLKVLDIGTGANGIYPLLGVKSYEWQVVASDVDKRAIENFQKIIEKNNLIQEIQLRLQNNFQYIFKDIIQPKEKFDLTICNPPFHESQEAMLKGSQRKWKNLGKSGQENKLNFGGKSHELWCPGGEKSFISKMIDESLTFKDQVNWFTSLVSQEANLKALEAQLRSLIHKPQIRVLEMSQGQKKSRVLAWSYLPTKFP